MVERTGCHLTGLDLEAAAIAYAQAQTTARGLEDRATFVRLDCSSSLPFANGCFDAVLCIDAISHLPDRIGTLREWARLLRPGGRLVFTDPAILSGAVAKAEFDIRALGFFLIVPPGLDEAAIRPPALPCWSARTAPPPPRRSPADCTPPVSGAPTSWSARREPIGSCSDNASSRPRPSWLEAVGCHASSSSPRNQPDRKVGPSSAGERHPTPVSG